MKLNVGCGREVLDGWTNLDLTWQDGMIVGRDVVADLCTKDLWFDTNHDTYDEILVSHVLEHLPLPLVAMENLWLVAKPRCKLTVYCPHGASDDAWEDQTHLRAYFPTSFLAFGQPYYWRADYGYRGDWEVEDVELRIGEKMKGWETDQIHAHVQAGRNMVAEMTATLRARKPIRAQDSHLMEDLRVTYR